MFNYYTYSQKIKEKNGENRFLQEEHIRSQRRNEYKQSSLKNSNFRVENFMIKMLDEPIVIKDEVKPWERRLRQGDPNLEYKGNHNLYYRYNSFSKIKDDRAKLYNDISMEKSSLNSIFTSGDNSQCGYNNKFGSRSNTKKYHQQLQPLHLRNMEYNGEDSKNLIVNPREANILSNAGSYIIHSNLNALNKKPRPYTIKRMAEDETRRKIKEENTILIGNEKLHESIEMQHKNEITKKLSVARSLLGNKGNFDEPKAYFCSVKNLAIDRKRENDCKEMGVSNTHGSPHKSAHSLPKFQDNKKKSAFLNSLQKPGSNSRNPTKTHDDERSSKGSEDMERNVEVVNTPNTKVLGRNDHANKNSKELANFALQNCNLNRPISHYLRKGQGITVMNLFDDILN